MRKDSLYSAHENELFFIISQNEIMKNFKVKKLLRHHLIIVRHEQSIAKTCMIIAISLVQLRSVSY
ncbi:MAG TPA: hypothetical protein DCP92_05020 [Nitrospiraceae bacterium]|nr:hypothetical protein [Nitrospiraceae bacterium]